MPYMLNSPYPYNQSGAPEVNYNKGDYRTISKLERNRAELAKTSQLEAEIARRKAWDDILFQKKLEELQKSLMEQNRGGGVGGSVSFAPQSRMGAMGRGSSGGFDVNDTGGMGRWAEMNPELATYFRLQRAVAAMGPQGISGGYPQFGQGYNFMTMLGLGNPQLAKGGIFGAPIIPGGR